MSEKEKKVIKIEVEGEDKVLWKKLKPKLIEAMTKFLDVIIDNENDTTIREEAKKFTSALLDYGKQKLNKAGIDNEKTLAEIDLLYSQKEKEVAEARKIHAEADALEIENTIKRLKLSLIGVKLLMVGENGNEEAIFLKQVDEFLRAIEEMGKGQGLLPTT